MKWLVALVCVVGCAKSSSEPAPAADERATISEGELTRGQDACKAYVDKICACTAPGAKDECARARALPEAMRVSLEVARSPDSTPKDTALALDGVRKTAKSCIEQIAKLPGIGCGP